MLWGLGAFSGHIMNLISLLSRLMVLWIVNKDINPSYKLAWTILILSLIHIYIGFGNVVNMDKVVAVVSPDAAPIKRLVQAAKDVYKRQD